jgi:hypothetical protein
MTPLFLPKLIELQLNQLELGISKHIFHIIKLGMVKINKILLVDQNRKIAKFKRFIVGNGLLLQRQLQLRAASANTH